MNGRAIPGARRRALVATIVVLVAGSIAAGGAGYDRADFDAVTSCGPAGVVTLWLERASTACGPGTYPLAHAEGGPPAGLPELGQIDEVALDAVEFAGDELLGHPIALHGPVPLASAPERTVERTCRTSRASRRVLAVVCDGPDPEAACTGTLTLREAAP